MKSFAISILITESFATTLEDMGPKTTQPITIDLLASDLADLLDDLHIPKVHAVIGVSLRGATALKFALKYPGRLDRFVACDFTARSPANAAQAWNSRIAMAEKGTKQRWEGGSCPIMRNQRQVRRS